MLICVFGSLRFAARTHTARFSDTNRVPGIERGTRAYARSVTSVFGRLREHSPLTFFGQHLWVNDLQEKCIYFSFFKSLSHPENFRFVTSMNARVTCWQI